MYRPAIWEQTLRHHTMSINDVGSVIQNLGRPDYKLERQLTIQINDRGGLVVTSHEVRISENFNLMRLRLPKTGFVKGKYCSYYIYEWHELNLITQN
ncbi:hypothetical protein BDZ94DRAFT_1255228 [Collybia nuda]|uniref:Uncharacterized protein n=1 Tax=Collybia nuda TaxID=64659 RepID=A0A9P6CGC0_9AGAR|nr:hypothetical protein BDZ94DRAFT_1255228 [Collybia nuda]